MIDKSEINFSNVVVDDRKLTEYLMNENHARGKSKAEVFRSRGFSKENTDELKGFLIEHGKANQIIYSEETLFGILVIIEGNMNSPDGRGINIRSVWIVEHNQNFPKFVTAYPT